MSYSADELLDLKWDRSSADYETFQSSDENEVSELEEAEYVWSAAELAEWERKTCPVEKQILSRDGDTYDAMRAHKAFCAVCESTRKTVVSDRLSLGTKNSSCCGEAA